MAWSVADAAELDVLVHTLVCAHFDHCDACPECRRLGKPCEKLREGTAEASQNVVDWRDGRLLRSRAEALRLEQDRIELERAKLRAARRADGAEGAVAA